MLSAKILLHVTGSVSCYKACELTSILVNAGHEVQISLSEGACKFIQTAVFEGLSHRKVLLQDMFLGNSDCIPHITLSQNWADLIVVYPASANCISRLACGLSDDLFGAIFLANNFEKPVLIAPAMNSNMFLHPSVQENLAKLENWGVNILPPEDGMLACGKSGVGKLMAPLSAYNYILSALSII